MKSTLIIAFGWLIISLSFNVSAAENDPDEATETDTEGVVWAPGMDVETLWLNYTNSKDGITWGQSSSYPEYSQVNEGDTFMVEVDQGPCLMEFFHNRWRRANDVRRWDDSVNEYGGCPYVFD